MANFHSYLKVNTIKMSKTDLYAKFPTQDKFSNDSRVPSYGKKWGKKHKYMNNNNKKAFLLPNYKKRHMGKLDIKTTTTTKRMDRL